MSHICPGYSEDLGMTGERASRDFRELTIITGRQVGGSLPHMLFDQMKIIDEPFGGGSNRLSGSNRCAQFSVSFRQCSRIVGKPPYDGINGGRRPRCDLRSCEALRVFAKPLDAE